MSESSIDDDLLTKRYEDDVVSALFSPSLERT